MANVPIVTEVTKAQLDALVAANGLNEGLQYKVTDKGYNVLATSASTYIITGAIPYKKWIGQLTKLAGVFGFIEFENTFGEAISWSQYEELGVPTPGLYVPVKATPFVVDKIFFPNIYLLLDYLQLADGQMGLITIDEASGLINVSVMDSTGAQTDSWGVTRIYVEIREYY